MFLYRSYTCLGSWPAAEIIPGTLLPWEVLSCFPKGLRHIQHLHFIFIICFLASRNIVENYLLGCFR